MTDEKMGGVGAVLAEELALARGLGPTNRAAILVEGESDRRAVVALARRLGRDLGAEGVTVIAITGATNVGRFLELLLSVHDSIEIVGMCDYGERDAFVAAFADVGLPKGVYVCDIDLEEELIRALGTDRMLEVIDSQDELRAFHSFQNQPDQRKKTVERQMWRWLGNRKIRYASVLVEALALDGIPEPLHGVLTATTDDDDGTGRRE